MNKDPLVSIIIPTYNSGSDLDTCLKSIKEQTYKNIEIIVIERWSKNNLGNKESIENRDNIKIIRGEYNKPEARNTGIKNSKGDILFFADSDYVLEKGLIKEVVNTINDFDALFIPEEYIGYGYMTSCRNLEKDMYQGIEIIEAPRIYKRWITEKISFDEMNEGPDEYDFYTNALRLGIKTSRIKSKIYLSKQSLNLKKKFRYGKFFVYYQNKHKKNDTIQMQIDMNYRLNLILRAFKISPLRASGLFIIKSLEFSTFSLGRFMGTFDRKIQMSSVSVKDEFNSIGQDYERDMYQGSLGNKFVGDTEKKIIIKRVEEIFKDRKIKVLDVGAGNGRWSREFLKLGYDVTALDISENMCKYIKNNNTELKVICGNIENVDINEKFDLIFSFRNFKYVRDMGKALKNMKKLLKDDGYILVEMPNKNNPFYLLANTFAPILYGVTGKIGKYFILANMISEKEFEEKLDNLFFEIKKEELLTFPHKFYSIIDNGYILNTVNIIDQSLSKIMPRSIIYSLKMVNYDRNDEGNRVGNDEGNHVGNESVNYVGNEAVLIERQIEGQPLVSIVIPTYNRKEKLIRLIKSIQESNYNNLEIIVVDDTSTDGTYDIIKKTFPNIQIIRNEKELLLAGSRNIGIKHATGKYIFLIDDDNVIDKNCITVLKDVLEKDNTIGMSGPVMYYLQNPDKIWWAGTERNMTTSKTVLNDKIEKIKKCKDIPNAFMVKKDIIDNIGFFDEEIFSLHYDEADFGERVRRSGYYIICDPKAKIWHDIPEGIESLTRFRHVHNSTRAYYAARNRIIFHKKYSTRLQFILFIFVFNWVMTLYYITIIMTDTSLKYNTRIGITNSYIKGIIDGI